MIPDVTVIVKPDNANFWEQVATSGLGGLIGSVIGAVVGAWFAYRFGRKLLDHQIEKAEAAIDRQQSNAIAENDRQRKIALFDKRMEVYKAIMSLTDKNINQWGSEGHERIAALLDIASQGKFLFPQSDRFSDYMRLISRRAFHAFIAAEDHLALLSGFPTKEETLYSWKRVFRRTAWFRRHKEEIERRFAPYLYLAD